MAEGGFVVRGEIDVEFHSEAKYSNTMREWFEGALRDLFSDELEAILGGPPLDPKGMRGGVPLGPPDSWWGFCSLTERVGRNLRDSARVISEKNLDWFYRKISSGPFSATVGISKLGDNGSPRLRLARITVERQEGAESWVRLGCDIPEYSLRDSGFQGAFLRFMKTQANTLGPSFGHVAHRYNLENTALEEVLGPPWLLAEQTVPESRQYLRGYSWVTLCPKELSSALGGKQELLESGAFCEVEELADGAIWLQATPEFAAYDDNHARAVWAAVSPALRPGVPMRSEPQPTDPPLHVVYEDARNAKP
ncbi:hypothetical protein AB0I77_36125 [Streptomyces sp. NPDC050619]|uniref:hypothetical protein n=1 Tax=Streptomyces sp. NPDC050619 TaxID=3157214 RepID=UPI0034237FF4